MRQLRSVCLAVLIFAFALFLLMAAFGSERETQPDKEKQLNMRYKPVPVVPALGIRG